VKSSATDTATITSLQAQLSQASGDLFSLQARLSSTAKELTSPFAAIETLRTTSASQQETLKDNSARIGELESDVEARNTELMGHQEQTQQREQRLQHMPEEIQRLKVLRQGFQHTLAYAGRVIAHLRARRRDVEAQLEAEIQAAAALWSRCLKQLFSALLSLRSPILRPFVSAVARRLFDVESYPFITKQIRRHGIVNNSFT